MTLPTEIQFFLALIALVGIALVIIGHSGVKLAKKHGTDVRVVWYLFSLSAVATGITTEWASSVGAIDPQGVFKGEVGGTINALLKFMLDLDTDLKIFSAILVVILIPQTASYILSGLFGCASAPIFVGEAIRFFVWSIVKSFVVAAGVILSFGLLGYLSNWNGWSAKGAASMSSVSLFLLTVSFAMLYVYHDVHDSVEKPMINCFPRFQRLVTRLQNWLTRNEQ